LDLIANIGVNEQDPTALLKSAELLIKEASLLNETHFIHEGYLQKGHALRMQGELEQALKAYFGSLQHAYDLNDKRVNGALYVTIADVYSESGNSENAILYYDKAILTLAETTDTFSLATALINAGDEFLNQRKFERALVYFEDSRELYSQISDRIGLAFNLGNEGMAYAGLGQNKIAEEKLNSSIEILEESGDYYFISVYLTYLSDLYLEKNDKINAIKYAKRSLDLANSYGLKEQISDASLQLSDIYEQTGNNTKALNLYKNHITYRDSFNNIETVQELANMRTDYEVSQKQLEVDLLEEQKKTQRLSIIGSLAGLGVMILFAIGLVRRNRFISKTKKIIENEKEKSENLLLNILPEETAEELKQNGKVAAKKHEAVSVFFSDFVGFTKYAENLTPDEVVAQLDYYFSHFDSITEKYGLEKIKTIGDAYMCTSGLNKSDPNHAATIIKVAKEIQQFVADAKQEEGRELPFDIRIGINSGSVVAGVVGHKKFAYDIWGDTVNIASRMESNSTPGRINISENTYKLVKDNFDCTHHGDFVTKNGNDIGMYFVGEELAEE